MKCWLSKETLKCLIIYHIYIYIYNMYIYIHIYIYIYHTYIYIYIYTHIHFMTYKKTMPAPNSDNAVWFPVVPALHHGEESREVWSSAGHHPVLVLLKGSQNIRAEHLVTKRPKKTTKFSRSNQANWWYTTNKNVDISPALQPNSERFQQGSTTVPVFRGVHFRVTSPLPQRLKPNRFAVGNYTLW